MTFDEILDQAIAMLQRRGRLTYSTLKRQFQLDDAALEDLKNELIEGQRLALDEQANVLVWTGADLSASHATAPPASTQDHVPLAYTPAYLAEKMLTSKSALEGERKQVTVLFADLRGSTELIRDLDPEQARAILDPALHAMMEAVHRYEGTVNQVLGDGIMALFGAPIAHEDHAARACYAALAMQDALRRYAEEVRRTHGLPIQMRVGLNAGEVVARAIGNDLYMDYSAVGLTTVLAARMEQLATPGSILLTAATLRLVEGMVQANPLGPVPVKGVDEPIEVFELVRASAIRRRLQAAVARGLTRFVGRQTELAALHQALERAGAGHGQVVALLGEAGVGKSRLVYEVVHSHRTQGWLVLESASVSYGKATPYFPVLDLLKRYVQVEDRDDTRTIRARVTGQVLTLDAALQETIPALLALLDALPEDSPFRALDPPQRRRRTLDGLKRVLLRESQVQPLLLVFEDLHWIDTETQALLDGLVESLPTARLLLLVNYRPEYQHGWGSKTYYTQVRLDPLHPVSAHELLHALLGDDPGLAPLKELLIARTEGNPFFLEESVRTLVESGVLVDTPGAYRLVPHVGEAPRGRPEVGNHRGLPLPIDIHIPATVQAVLAARIDRLPPEEKRLLQTATVIGMEVSLPLLQAITELPESALHQGLTHLQAAEFLYETRLFPEREYTFKHALTHEVAYRSLLQERRRTLHAQIVEALETLAGDRLAEQVERLADHAVRGEVWDKALRYCRQAGAKAMERSASREAVGCYERALAALAHLPEHRELREQAIDLWFDLYSAHFVLGQHERILHDLRTAETLAEALDDPRRLGRVSVNMAQYFLMARQYTRAIASSQHALALAAASGDHYTPIEANNFLGLVYFLQGDYRQAIDAYRRAMAALEGDRRYERFGQPVLPAVRCRTYLSLCLAEMGAFAEGIAVGEEGIHIAEAVQHPVSLVSAYRSVGLQHLGRGDLHQALPRLERAASICEEADLPVHFSLLAPVLGAAYVLCGRVDEAVRLLERVLEQIASSGRIGGQTSLLFTLGEAHLRAGRLEEASTLAARALEHARTYQERGHEAYALRLLGEIAAHRNPPEVEEADVSYRQSLALANEIGMRPLQAHCHLGLGTLYAKTGRQEQARTEVSAAITLYRVMEMTFWLLQAEAALGQVDG
jgi:class 3 adenylate cyclase/tetratricopeptide (TPR) repeat protein